MVNEYHGSSVACLAEQVNAEVPDGHLPLHHGELDPQSLPEHLDVLRESGRKIVRLLRKHLPYRLDLKTPDQGLIRTLFLLSLRSQAACC